MTTTTFNTYSAAAEQDLRTAENIPLRLRLSMFTFGILSYLGPEHVLFLPLSILGIFSGLINYSWQREIALRGEEINRGVFLHTGGNPKTSKGRYSASLP